MDVRSGFSVTYSYNSQPEKTITNFDQREYLLPLVFREELYKLKLKLYNFVERVFNERRANWWGWVNRRSWNTPFDGRIENVDPSNLLKIVARHRYFREFGDIQGTAESVYQLRHQLYGHIPELLLPVSDEEFEINLTQIDELSRLITPYLQ